MLKYLIVCPLVFIAGYIDAIAGGGGLVSLPAYFLTGLPAVSCIGTNKLSSSMGTTLATIKYGKKGYIPFLYAAFAIPCAFAGSYIGANIALVLDENIIRMIMLVLLPAIGIYVFRKKDFSPKGEEKSKRVTILLSMLISFVVGIYDGLYGPGTGTFLLLLFTGLAHMQLEKANGLTKSINLTTNLAALVVYIMSGNVDFVLGLAAGAFNIAGNYLGAKRFEKGGSRAVKPVIIVVLSVFFVKTVYELFIK